MRILFVLVLLGIPAAAKGQIAVITHETSFIDELTMGELSHVYSGEMTSFSPICIQRDLSEAFFQTLIGKSEKAVKRLWVKVLLSGRVSRGPVGLNSDAEVLRYVQDNPSAIGFVSVGSVDETVKVLAIDGHQPSDAAYPLQAADR